MAKSKESAAPVQVYIDKKGSKFSILQHGTDEVLKSSLSKTKALTLIEGNTGLVLASDEEFAASKETAKSATKETAKSATKLAAILAALNLQVTDDTPQVKLTIDGGISSGRVDTYRVLPLNGRTGYLIGKSTIYVATCALNGRAAIVSLATSASPGFRYDSSPLLDVLSS